MQTAKSTAAETYSREMKNIFGRLLIIIFEIMLSFWPISIAVRKTFPFVYGFVS